MEVDFALSGIKGGCESRLYSLFTAGFGCLRGLVVVSGLSFQLFLVPNMPQHLHSRALRMLQTWVKNPEP